MFPLGTKATLDALGIESRHQLDKLVHSNTLLDIRLPGSRNLKLDSDAVTALAERPVFTLTTKQRTQTRVLALHLHPIEAWDGEDRHMWGFDLLNTDRLSDRDRELAWVGYWNITADKALAMVDHVIVGDVAGWIPPGLGRHVTGVQFTEHGVLFLVSPLSADEEELYTDKRFQATPGPHFQYL